jgi:tryptophan 7-halogenase
MKPLERIVILGGDSCSWLVAATLAQQLSGVEIVVIEPADAQPAFSAESLGSEHLAFFACLGVPWQEVLVHARGSYKLAHLYSKPEQSIYHGLGGLEPGVDLLEVHNLLARLRTLGIESGSQAPDPERYSLTAWAARKAKFAFPDELPPAQMASLQWGMHFNLGIFIPFLRQRAQALGVRTITQSLAHTALDDTGAISSVTTADGTEWSASLYIDCTGAASRVLGESLGVAFDSWGQWLPYDSCMVSSYAHSEPFRPVTELRQLATGAAPAWLKKIPLRDRMVVELYYQRASMSDEAAASLLASSIGDLTLGASNVVRLQPGRRHRFWQKNCVAMGTAALDTGNYIYSSLFTAQRSVARLLEFFPDKTCNERLAAEYNRVLGDEFDNLRDFHLLHQHWLSDQSLSDLLGSTDLPPSLAYKLRVYADTGRYVFGENELVSKEQWLSLMLTMGFWPKHRDLLAEGYEPAELRAFYDAHVAAIERLVDRLPQHLYHLANFLKKTGSH